MCGGGCSASSLVWAIYYVIAVVGCLGGCVGRCLYACCAVGCVLPNVVVMVLPVVYSPIFCCRCAMTPRSLAWVREQNLPARAFAVHVSCRRAVLLISGVF